LHDLLDGLDGAELRPAQSIAGSESILGVGEVRDVDVKTVVHDNRDVEPGALFCCIPGATADGHAFAAAAVDAGAVALLVERWLELEVPQVRVASVREAVGPLAARFHGEPSRAMRVIGVTGTNGKTTTTYLIEAVARAAGERTGVIGTITARIGDRLVALRHTTPEATDLQALLAQMRDSGVTTVAMEVSSHALDQHRVDGTQFAATCFTNLSHDHLDYHGTVDAYLEAKARLFAPVFTSRAAINIDDPQGRVLRNRAVGAGIDVLSYAVDDPEADVSAEGIALSGDGTSFTLAGIDGTRVPVTTSLVGTFNVANALGAAAVSRLAGFGLDEVRAGLAAPLVVPGRMERIETDRDFVVLVDYAHTPDALATVLTAARALTSPKGRLAVVFGCGGDRDRAKRPVMGEIACRLADAVVVTSDNPRSEDPQVIASEILAGTPADARPTVELDRRRAIADALRHAGSGDVVVIAGKGHEGGQTAAGVTVPFDDRVVAREELEALACPR
jgi:UDP-N-acetylmuramoyl-L-alanyl-D-glutamate--2,6-diaminopimelate ligase